MRIRIIQKSDLKIPRPGPQPGRINQGLRAGGTGPSVSQKSPRVFVERKPRATAVGHRSCGTVPSNQGGGALLQKGDLLCWGHLRRWFWGERLATACPSEAVQTGGLENVGVWEEEAWARALSTKKERGGAARPCL